MRLITQRFIEEAWHEISPNGHEWPCYEQYEIDLEEMLDDVDASAEASYLTKLDSEQKWSNTNITLVNVHTDYDWNKIQAGAIRYGGLA